MFDATRSKKGLHERTGRPPSAIAELFISHGRATEGGYRDQFVLTEQLFEGATEADVNRQVEEWVQQQFERMAAALRWEFNR